jgi:hypothetical protein
LRYSPTEVWDTLTLALLSNGENQFVDAGSAHSTPGSIHRW